MDLIKKREEILIQNRIKFFKGVDQDDYLYDALSQNIYPVPKYVVSFFSKNSIDIGSDSVSEMLDSFCDKLLSYTDKKVFKRAPETHLTINFSNKCNLNCSYCYRHKNNKNTMNLQKAFEVIDYADKYFKMNNDEIIFSVDMTGESLLDYEQIIQFDDKLAEYENLYIEEKEIQNITPSDFLKLIIANLYKGEEDKFDFAIPVQKCLEQIILDPKLYNRFSDKDYVKRILQNGNYDPLFLDKKRLLRLNRELLETFYSDYLIHKDYQQFRIWFMSNGTRITQKEIELIKKIRIDPFWISLDGPEDIHNKNRKYYDNKGSYSDVIKGIKLLQENNINVKISCVLTADYPYPDKLLTYFKSLGISAIQMCPIRNGCPSSFSEESLAELLTSYDRLYQMLFDEAQKGDFSSFELLSEDMSMIAFCNLFGRIRQSGRCTWGDEVIIDNAGDLYPCLYVIGNEKYKLGNMNEKKNSQELLKPISVNDVDKCKTCWGRYICGGTCHYNSIVNDKSVYSTDEIECKIRNYAISKSISLIIKFKETKTNFTKLQKIFGY